MAVGFVNSLGISFPLTGTYGGTGINNGANTLTISANSTINQDVSTSGLPTFVKSYAGNFVNGYTTTATAAGTTTLLASSTYQQYFTGATTQTVVLPVTSTMVLGEGFLIVNNSSGVVTVQSSGANIIQAMDGGTQMWVTVISTSGTTAASWNAAYSDNTAGVSSVSGTLDRITTTGTSAVTVDIAATYVGQTSITTLGTIATGTWNGTAIDVAHGGTGNTTFTAYAPIVAGTTATSPFASASTGFSNIGYVLTSNGNTAVPSWQAPAAGGLTYINVSGTSQTATAQNAYGLQNAGAVTVTLDVSGNWAVGQEVVIEGYGAGGFVVQLAASQRAYGYNGIDTTVAGTITTRDPLNTTNAAVGCKLGIRYTAANTFFFWAYQGNFVTA